MAKLKCIKHNKRVFVLDPRTVHRDDTECGEFKLKMGEHEINAFEVRTGQRARLVPIR